MESDPHLLQRINLLKKTGKLNLCHTCIKDFSFFTPKLFSNQFQFVHILDASYTKITSFYGLAKLPNITTVNGDNSLINSFENFYSISSAYNYSFMNTPLSKQKHYKLSIFILSSGRAIQIDKKAIPNLVKQRASKYPAITAELLNAGWELEFPPPSEDRFSELAKEYKIEIPKQKEQSFTPSKTSFLETQEHLTTEQQEQDQQTINQLIEIGDFQNLSEKLLQQHHLMIMKNLENFGLVQKDEMLNSSENQQCDTSTDEDAEFINQMKVLFSQYGQTLDISSNQSILNAIDDLLKE